MNGDLFAGSSATFSGCGLYRYELRRTLDVFGGAPKGRTVAWLMLNPSTADASTDDPTIRKCRGFSQRWGYSEFVVVNLYAWRATDPREMLAAADPVGPENDRHLLAAAASAELVVCAWGCNARADRRAHVLELLELYAHKLRCLKIVGGDEPGHPLMLPYKLPLQPFPAP
jgi:hypothetical protein